MANQTIVTNVGHDKILTAMTSSDKVSPSYFKASSDTTFDPNMTDIASPFLIKGIESVFKSSESEFRLYCHIQATEATDLLSTIGIFDSDDTLLFVSKFDPPLNINQDSFIEVIIKLDNYNNAIDFNEIPFDETQQNALFIDMLNKYSDIALDINALKTKIGNIDTTLNAHQASLDLLSNKINTVYGVIDKQYIWFGNSNPPTTYYLIWMDTTYNPPKIKIRKKVGSVISWIEPDVSTLNGITSDKFVRSDVDDTLNGNYIFNHNVEIKGNLTVKGTFTTIQSQDLQVKDNTIILNYGETATGVSKGWAGIEIDRGTLPNVTLLWDEYNDRWSLNYGDFTIAGNFELGDTNKIIFRSSTDPIGDYGQISYDTDNNTYAIWGDTSNENGALRISIFNNAAGNRSDVIALESPAGIFLNAPNIFQGTGNKIWHEGDMGHGSGLDADTLDGKHWSDILLLVESLVIKKPTIINPPANGETESTITSSPYETSEWFYGTHQASDWEIAEDSTFTTLVESSYNDTSQLTTYTISSTSLDDTKTYYVRVRYKSDNHVSSWSDPHPFKVFKKYIQTPTVSQSGGTSMYPVFSLTPFTTSGYSDTWQSTHWQIATDSSFTSIILDYTETDPANQSTLTIDSDLFSLNTTYYIRAKYKGSSGLESEWSSTYTHNSGLYQLEYTLPSTLYELQSYQIHVTHDGGRAFDDSQYKLTCNVTCGTLAISGLVAEWNTPKLDSDTSCTITLQILKISDNSDVTDPISKTVTIKNVNVTGDSALFLTPSDLTSFAYNNLWNIT